ncbi:TOM1-like protein 2 [Silurus meridionalis]|nr:TOM1-like protein 2 [Silurus meridionalis]
MQLFVRAQNLHTLEVTGHETVQEIKAHVQTLEGLCVEDQVLLLSGTPLEDASTLVRSTVLWLVLEKYEDRHPRSEVVQWLMYKKWLEVWECAKSEQVSHVEVEKATKGSLEGEDWGMNMEICDIINETDDGMVFNCRLCTNSRPYRPKVATRALKKKIVGNKNFREVMLALTVLETCVKNCGHRFHVHVCTRDFVEGVLVRTILPKNNPPMVLHAFLILSIVVTANKNLNIFSSATSSSTSCLLLNATVSKPYNIAGLTTVL